jgi:hypothetical protein
MERRLEVQLISLSTFIEEFLSPALRVEEASVRLVEGGLDAELLPQGKRVERELLVRRRFGPALDHARASLWEAYLWLYFGVEVGFFPRHQSEEVTKAGFQQLTGYQGPAPRFAGFFPGAVRLALDSAFRRGKFLVDLEYPKFSDGDTRLDTVIIIFQALLSQIKSFEQDGIAQCLVATMNFADNERWAQLLKQDVAPGQLELLLRERCIGPVDATKETLLAGFFRVIAFMANFLSSFDELRREPSRPQYSGYRFTKSPQIRLASDDLALLERRTKEICFWRLNFYDETVSRRFDELQVSIAATVGNALKDEAGRLPESYHTPTFYRQVAMLIERWKVGVTMQPVPRAQSASG